MNFFCKFFKCAFYTSLLFICLDLHSSDSDKKNMIDELKFIKSTFEYAYAPKEWKNECFGWNLNQTFQKAKEKILSKENISLKDYHLIVKEFFRSTKDYHVNVEFFSTEEACLPIEIKYANEKYFIAYVDRKKLNIISYPIFIGDEILTFDGKAIGDIVSEIQMEEFGTTGPGTDHELSLMILTNRMGTLGQSIPSGPITIKLNQHAGVKSYQMIWSYKPEEVLCKTYNSTNMTNFLEKKKVIDIAKPWMTPFFQKDKLEKSLLKYADSKDKLYFSDDEEDEQSVNPHEMGVIKNFMPTLGKVWWENKGFYHAYIFETDDHKLVGYLRIPHYADMDFLGHSFSELIFIPELKKILKLFEERTDALVIDQMNNPGGSVFFLYAIASLLTDQPLVTPKHRMSISFSDIQDASYCIPILSKITSDEEAKLTLNEMFGSLFSCNDVNYQMSQFLLEYFRFIKKEWDNGKTFTDPFYILGIDHIKPDPIVNYTKPILFLINHLDFSGGDFLPAILKDNKRVKLMGTQTAGAGGYVNGMHFVSRFGVRGFSWTGSIAERVNGQPIENLGVTPDVLYEISENDLKYGYQEFKENILENLKY